MKFVLFRKGQPGRLASVRGSDARLIISDVLGGRIKQERLDGVGLYLVTLKEGERMRLPYQYLVRTSECRHIPVMGDCAVIRLGSNQHLQPVTPKMVETVNQMGCPWEQVEERRMVGHCMRVAHPEHGTFSAYGAYTKTKAIQMAARQWGTPWSSIARDCTVTWEEVFGG